MILWADSFDHYGTVTTNMTDGAWAQVVGGSLSNTFARTGTRSFACTGSADAIRRVFGAAKTTVGVGMAVYKPALPSVNNTNELFSFRDAANAIQIIVAVDTTGILSVWRGNFVTKIGDSTVPVITAAAWNHIEVKVTINDTTGAVEVRVNQVTVINLTGVDTKASALTETSQFQTGNQGTNSQGHYVDDIVAWDTSGSLNNDFVGDLKVATDFPDADTADVAWTRSTGATNFGVIDENPPNGDTDYLTATTVGLKFGVTFPDLPAEASQIPAVIMVNKTRKTDAGDANFQGHVISNGDTGNGTDRPVTTAYLLYHDVFETDPDTAAPWTKAAAEIAAYQGERTL